MDGVRLSVVTHGRGVGPPLFLLHGLPTSSYLWRDVMRDLEHDARTIAPDLVGLGSSERPEVAGYDLPAQARRLVGLLDVLDVDRVLLVGHGLGGAVAVLVAVLAPERVTGLALLGAPVHADTWPAPAVLPLTLPLLGPGAAALAIRAPAVPRAALAAVLGPHLPPRVLDHYVAPLLTADGARGLTRFVRSVDQSLTEAAWEALRRDAPPTLLLWGSEDRVHALSYGRRLADQLPAASWVPLHGCGHLLAEMCPERVAEELEAFRGDL